MENKPQSSFSWQTFSIFLSSTFADMHAERDHLKNIVFPKLEEELSKRKIKLEIVDLRWGVDTESSEKEEEREKNVLNVCLDEIERCHPFFIGLLGDRYGWVPDPEGKRISDISAGKALFLPNKGKSVTALEIEFGVLVNPKQIKRSMFYFREPMDYSRFNPQKAALYCEEFDPKLSSGEKEERRISLEKLKSIITEHFKKIGLPGNVQSYVANWDQENQKVIGLKEWGDKVYEDILRECENQAKDTWDILPKNWQEQELTLLDAFIESHTHVTTVSTPDGEVKVETFCGREKLLGELRQFLISSEKANCGIVLTGESGSGKSAVFSKIFDGMKQENCFILAHSAGLSPRSRNIMDMLQIWNQQLSEFLGIVVREEKFADEQEGLRRPQLEAFSQTEEKKTGIEKAQDEFRELLFMAAQRKLIVLLIDALDRFEPTERAKYMTWLPESLPENVRVLCTAVTGTEQKAVEFHKKLKVKSIDVFSKEDAQEMLLSICTQNHKTLSNDVVQSILQNERDDKLPAVSSPLWLSLSVRLLLVLDQDDFERIYLEEGKKRMEGKKVEDVLENYMKKLAEGFPPLPGELFLHLLLRASSVFGKEFTDAVFDYIACSRNGLRESDLEKLFNEKKGIEWDVLLFANLRRWFKGHLQEQGFDAQWNLNHSILRSAVLESMDKEKNRTIHQSIAHHLYKLPSVDPLRTSETMYHLMKGGNAEQSVNYYTSELLPEEVDSSTKILAEAIAEDKGGMEWIFIMLETAKNEAFFCIVSRYVINLYDTLEITGRLSANLNLLEKLVDKIARRLGNSFHINELFGHIFCVFFIKLGSTYAGLGNLEKALHYYEEGHKMCKQLYDLKPQNQDFKQGLSIANEKLGEVHSKLGNLETALNYFEEDLRLSKELYQSNFQEESYKLNLTIALEKIGETHSNLGNLEKALNSFEEHLRLSKEFSDINPQNERFKTNLAFSYEKIGETHNNLGNKQKALNSHEESLRLLKQLYESNPENVIFKHGLSVLHFKLSSIYEALGNLEKALNFSQEGLRLTKELYESNLQNVEYKNGLAASYLSIGGIYASQDNFEKALNFYERALGLARELYKSDIKDVEYKNNLGIIYSHHGEVYIKLGNWEKALEDYETGLQLFKEQPCVPRQRVSSANVGSH